METLNDLWGTGKDLNVLQMCSRGLVVFILTLVLLRISGRRSFGLHTPLDSIIVILLGAVLSRSIVGASPFVPVAGVSLLIVVLHRLLGWLTARYPSFSRFIEGHKIILYRNGQFMEDNEKRALVCREDIMQGVRKSALTEDMTTIDTVYMERTGEITVVKKQEGQE